MPSTYWYRLRQRPSAWREIGDIQRNNHLQTPVFPSSFRDFFSVCQPSCTSTRIIERIVLFVALLYHIPPALSIGKFTKLGRGFDRDLTCYDKGHTSVFKCGIINFENPPKSPKEGHA